MNSVNFGPEKSSAKSTKELAALSEVNDSGTCGHAVEK